MNAVTRLSSKGQVVIPKSVRRSRCWPDGMPLEVVERPDGVLLRPVAPAASPAAIEAAIDRLQALVGYGGPRIPDDQWPAAIDAMFREKAARKAQ